MVNLRVRDLASDTLVYGVGLVLNKFISFFLVPFYTRALTPAEFGVVDILTVSITLVAPVLSLQLESGLVRFYYDTEDHHRKALCLTVALAMLFADLIFATVVLIVAGWISGMLFQTSEYILTIRIVALLLPISSLSAMFTLTLRLQRMKRPFVVAIVAQLLITGLGGIFFVVVKQMGPLGYFLGVILGKLPLALLFIAFYASAAKDGLKFGRIPDLLRYSIPLIPATVGSWGIRSASRYMLLAMVGSGGVGVFSLSTKIASVILLAKSALRQAWAPFAMQIAEQKNKGQIYSRTLELWFAVGAIISILVTSLSKEITAVLAPEAYSYAAALVGLMAFVYLLQGMEQVVGIVILLRKKTYLTSIAFLIGGSITLLSSYIFIRRWGIIGAPAANALGALVGVLLIYSFAQRNLRINYRMKLVWGLFLIVALSLGFIPLLDSIVFRLLAGVIIISVIVLTFRQTILEALRRS